MIKYSTRKAAKKLGISWRTINRYIVGKKFPLPKMQRIGGVRVRLWSEADIEKVRRILPKIVNGRKLRYKKQATK